MTEGIVTPMIEQNFEVYNDVIYTYSVVPLGGDENCVYQDGQ